MNTVDGAAFETLRVVEPSGDVLALVQGQGGAIVALPEGPSDAVLAIPGAPSEILSVIAPAIAPANRWLEYALAYDTDPTLVATLPEGVVYAYSTGGEITHYRLFPNPYDRTRDAFYSEFDGTALSGLLATQV